MHKFLLGLLFTFSCTLGYTYAPVVDESENFAINSTPHGPESQQALAHDDTANNSYFGDTNKPNYPSNQNEIAKLLNQLQGLQQTVQELRGQIDNQNHTIETLKNQQITLYKDLDDRLNKMNVSHAPQITSEPSKQITPAVPQKIDQTPLITTNQNTSKATPTTTALNPADEQISYMAAYNFVEKKELKKAELALQEFIQHYPQSGYTPNAEYWLGEVYLQEKNYSAAMAHFENVVNNFQSSNKHAASLYKLGVSLAENGQTSDAKTKYQAVIQQYPDSDTAKLAQEQLNRL